MFWGRLSGEDVTLDSARMGPQPGPAGRTSSKKRTRVARSVGFVRYVAATHTAVVTPTVTSSETCEGTFVPIFPARKKARATTNELTIAEISLHALIRHQNQRSR